jgi:hypothetical protein
MPQDVMKIFKDLEAKAVGVDPTTKKMPEGYFISFRPIGLPIPEEDFANPWTPMGAEMKKILTDAKNAATPPGAGATPDGTGTVTVPATVDINQLITAGIGASMQSYIQTFYLTNQKLEMDPTWRVMPSAGHVDDAWYAIINGAHAIPPKTVVSDEIKKALAAAQAKLVDKDGNPTPMYSAYNTYREAYQDKVKTINREFSDAMSDPAALRKWPIDGKLFQDDVNKAWNEWQGFGHKVEVETAINLLGAQGQDPAVLLINRAKQKWENSLVHFDKIGDLPYTFMQPRKWYSRTENNGWYTYSKVDYQTESHYKENTTTWAASGGFSLGFFSIGGSAGGSETKTDLKLKTSNLSITFSYSVADVIRPWLDTNLLNLGNWFLVGDYKKNTISDGSFKQQLKRGDPNVPLFLPSIVTSIVLVRDLCISWSEMNSHKATIDKTVGGGGFVGIGPFMVGGGGSSSKKQGDFEYRYTSEGLKCPGVQCVGYVSTILPASPKLDSKEYMQAVKKTTAVATAKKVG